MSKARIDDIEVAIRKAIQDDETITSYVPKHQIQSIGEREIDFKSGEMLVVPPAVLTLYLGGAYEAKNVTETVYHAREPFLLLAVVANLRGVEAAKEGGVSQERGAYDLLEDLKTLFAGKRPTVATGVDVLISIRNVGFEGINEQRHYTYTLEILADGIWSNVA